MKRMLCMLLVLLLVPCLALGEAFTLLTSCPLQVTQSVTYIDGAYQLVSGDYLICYESAQEDGTCLQVQAIVTSEGACVWEHPLYFRDLTKETVDDEIILQPDGFTWEYYPDGGVGEIYCRTTRALDGSVVEAQLDPLPRVGNTNWLNFADFTVSRQWTDAGLQVQAASLRTGATMVVPGNEYDNCIAVAQLGDELALFVRGEEGFGTLYRYDADLQEVSRMKTPIDHGEVVIMAQQGDTLYCFAMYAGDWESYNVYACDLTTGQWADDVPFVQLPNEYCSLRKVIPWGDEMLLLVDEGDTEEHPAPFGPYNWNYTDKDLYRMDADGSLTLVADLHGDAVLVHQEDERFTLLAKDENGVYALCTYAAPQENPQP